MSKNALKKELKMKQKEEERQKKEAEKQKRKAEMMANTQAQTKTLAVADDEDMDPTQYFENRLRTLAANKSTGAYPYPHKFPVIISIGDYLKKYAYLTDGEHLKDVEESIAGRIMSKRTSSSKLVFYDLHGGGVKVQVMADLRDSNMDEADFSRLHSSVRRGDIVGIRGYPGKSKRGELSIFPKEFTVLSHCLHMMPKQQKLQPGSEKTPAKIQDMLLNHEW